jgi:methylated-DNA-[protein]-cysteine S-methyltransferase
MYYQIADVKEECIGIVWRFAESKPLIENIFLPCSRNQLILKIEREYSAINITERSIPGGIAKQILEVYSGSKINFDYSLLNLAKLTKFSARVLEQTYKIPRGEVTTYSGLAAKIGSPGAARAVGTALANNPFPLVIPCHRVVRADGFLGGFGGGIKMKKELLGKEGVVADDKGRVLAKCFSAG